MARSRTFLAVAYLAALVLLFFAAERAAAQLAALAARAVSLVSAKTSPAREALPEKVAIRVPLPQSPAKTVTPTPVQSFSDFFWRDRESYGRRGGYGHGRYRSDDDEDDDEYGPRYREGPAGWQGAFRTVCVRLCDGYYWPISFATTPAGFDRDRYRCESSCGSPARLYVHRSFGEVESMVDLQGRPYTNLKTAFLYRSQYDANCKCRTDPWEEASKDQHRLYALEAARRKGDQVAARQFDELRAKMEAERRQSLAESVRQGKEAARGEARPGDYARQYAPNGASETDAEARASREERMSLGASTSSDRASRASSRSIESWRDRRDMAP